MSKQKQEQIMEVLKLCGLDDDTILDTAINLEEDEQTEDKIEDDKQEQLQKDLLLELNECY